MLLLAIMLFLAGDILPFARAADEGLNDLALKAGLMYFGTAVDNVSLNRSNYVAIVNNTHEWGQITAANGLKWDATEPSRNVFNWTAGNEIMDPALEHQQIRRCHTLVWHRALPEWLTSQTWTRDELLSILENHIKNVVTNYEGRCYAWDVVNEAFNVNGTWRSNIWYDTIGPEYVAFAFTTARKYTTAKLYYNDNNTTDINRKTDAVHALIKQLRADGVPIDGVGIQVHLVVGPLDYTAILQNMRYFASITGLELAVTELDIRIQLPNDAAKTEQQAVDYANVVQACQQVQACIGITVWDFWDEVSWIPESRPGFGDAQLFWKNLTRKPAYYRIRDVLRESVRCG